MVPVFFLLLAWALRAHCLRGQGALEGGRRAGFIGQLFRLEVPRDSGLARVPQFPLSHDLHVSQGFKISEWKGWHSSTVSEQDGGPTRDSSRAPGSTAL